MSNCVPWRLAHAQSALMRPSFDAGLKELAGASGYL